MRYTIQNEFIKAVCDYLNKEFDINEDKVVLYQKIPIIDTMKKIEDNWMGREIKWENIKI